MTMGEKKNLVYLEKAGAATCIVFKVSIDFS